jgi:hypothetical protein
MYLQDINKMKKEEIQVQGDLSQKGHMFEAFYMKMHTEEEGMP